MTRIGKYTAGMITANATGNAASKPRPPRPGFVAIPDGRDRAHDRVARARVTRKAVEHAHAEIEAVEQDIEEHRHPENQRPNRHQVENLVHLRQWLCGDRALRRPARRPRRATCPRRAT